MTVKRTIRIIPTAVQSWRGAAAAISRMIPAFLLLSAAFIALTYLQVRILDDMLKTGNPGQALRPAAMIFGLELAGAVLLAPMTVMIQRYILLDEIATGEKLLSSARRIVLSAAILAVIIGLAGLPVVVLANIYAHGLEPDLLLVQLIPVAALVALVLCFCLLPAIAVDAPHANLANALADTWFHLFRIFLLIAATALPVLFVQFLLWIGASRGLTGFSDSYFIVALKALPNLILVWVLAAASSYAYRCYADRLRQPVRSAVSNA